MSTLQQLDSWRKTCEELGSRQAEVLRELAVCGHGLSAWELAARLKRLVHAVRPRLTELKKLGLIRQSGERHEPLTNRHEAVWAAVEETGQLNLL